jgi:hypothetical protein
MGIIETMAIMGGLWFFLFVAAIVVIGVVSAEIDNIFAAVITLILLIGGAQFIFAIPVGVAVFANPLIVIFGMVVYTVVGLGYAVFFRYVEYLNSQAELIRRYALDFYRQHKDATEDDFLDSEQYSRFTPSANVDKITAWVILWPWALLWDICSKPTTWIYNMVYSLAGVMLDNVGKRVTKKILKK